MQTVYFLPLFVVLLVSQVNGFDICAAGKPYAAIQAVNRTGCTACSDYLLCVGFRNAVTQCSLISASDANTTATLISANNGGGGFSNYISTYLGATYNAAAVTNGLNGADCKALYGSSSNCTVGLDVPCRSDRQGPRPGPPGPGPRPGPPGPGPRPRPTPVPSRICRLPSSLL